MHASSDLAEKRCVPCRGGVPPLTATERDELHAHVPDWSVRDGVRLSVQTKAIKGLHANDFVLAAKIDRILGLSLARR